MTRNSILKILILTVLVLPLAACDSGVPSTSPTATRGAFTSTIRTGDPGDTQAEPTVTPEEATTEPTEVISEEPTPETVEEPTADTGGSDPQPTADASLPLGPLPDGPLTLVALGDSLTQGDGDYESDGGGFPVRLERELVKARPDSQVVNFGESGWTSTQMVESQLPGAMVYNPNLATVWIGSNNLWYNNGPEYEAQDIEVFSNDIDTTLRTLTAANVHVSLALLDDQTLRPYATADNYSNFTREQLAHMSQLTLKFNDVLRAKAKEYNATIVDFYNTTIFTDAATLADDGIHPNSAGYDIITKMWFDFIGKIL